MIEIVGHWTDMMYWTECIEDERDLLEPIWQQLYAQMMGWT